MSENSFTNRGFIYFVLYNEKSAKNINSNIKRIGKM